MNDQDVEFLRVSFRIAINAREKGNHPFGALLVDEHAQIVMQAENTVGMTKDCTAHAETNLMRKASVEYDSDFLERCTIYSSTEPCPMCVGAIFWANVRRLVYGLSEERFYEIVGRESEEVLLIPCRDIFKRGKKQVEIVGPLLEEEAREVHLGFWQ